MAYMKLPDGSYGAHYDSLCDFLSVVEQEPKGSVFHWREWMNDNKGGWYGMPDLGTGRRIAQAARTGWPAGADRIANLIDSIEMPRPRNVRRRAEWSDYGDHLDMDRVRSGQLDSAWRRTSRRMGNAPMTVRVLIDSIASGGTNAEEMAWRGVASAALTNALISAGYNVEVVSGFMAMSAGNVVKFTAVVKDRYRHWTLSDAAACTAPGFFRALGHAWHSHVSGGEQGYGYMPLELPANAMPDDSTIGFTALASQQINSRADAIAWVTGTLGKIEAKYSQE